MPTGGLSPGLTAEQIPPRELCEEMGGTAADLHYIGQFYTSNRISTGIFYVNSSIGVVLLDCPESGS